METSKASWSIVVIVLLVSRSIFCFLYDQLLHIWRHWDSSGLTPVPEPHSHWAWRSWTIWRRSCGCFQTDRVLGFVRLHCHKKSNRTSRKGSLARNKWFPFGAECFTGSHFSFVLVLFYWWNNDSEACSASSLRCLCSLVAVWFSDQWQFFGSLMMDPFLAQWFVDGATSLLDFSERLWIILEIFFTWFCVEMGLCNRPRLKMLNLKKENFLDH